MKAKQIFVELGKGIYVIALGICYYVSIFYLISFLARYESYAWLHKLTIAHAYNEILFMYLVHDFCYYIIPALIVAYLTSLLKPAHWSIHSPLIISPSLISQVNLYWSLIAYLHVENMSFAYTHLHRGVILNIESPVLLCGLPPVLLWLFYKMNNIRSQKSQLHITQNVM